MKALNEEAASGALTETGKRNAAGQVGNSSLLLKEFNLKVNGFQLEAPQLQGKTYGY